MLCFAYFALLALLFTVALLSFALLSFALLALLCAIEFGPFYYILGPFCSFVGAFSEGQPSQNYSLEGS